MLAHTPLNLASQEVVSIFSVLMHQELSGAADLAPLFQREDARIQKTLLYALLPVVVAFSFIVFIFYRAKRELFFKQKQVEFKLNISELEMKALRAQISPHFIFNCLNSIHHYMHSNDVPKAGEYLIKFSQLIRHVLETSSSRMIALADDLMALKLYMQLEQMRMNHSFDFEIKVNEDIDAESVQVPPLLIQPFVENSIWHGLNHRGPGGKIRIEITRTNPLLTCVIEDNGYEGGTKEDFDLTYSVKKTSMGMALINERLEVVNQLHDVKAGFKLTEIISNRNIKEGKRVTLVLPYEE